MTLFWEIMKTQHNENEMKNHNENYVSVPFSVIYWILLIFLQNVIEKSHF